MSFGLKEPNFCVEERTILGISTYLCTIGSLSLVHTRLQICCDLQ